MYNHFHEFSLPFCGSRITKGKALQLICGSGQDRTVDLTIFSRALVPTELPSQYLIVLVNSLK
jgi:hypothetical protein